MNTIPAREIKRHGISTVDKLLKHGPVLVTKNNRPGYVVMSEDEYAPLIERRGLWELLEQPTRVSRSKEEIDAQLRRQRGSWGKSR